MLIKYAINKLRNLGVFTADWGFWVMYLVFRAINVTPAAQIRLGLELIKIGFVKINLSYNLTLNKCTVTLTEPNPY